MDSKNHRIREKFILFLFENSKNMYRYIFKRKIKAWEINLDYLLQLEKDTLGNDLAMFLIKNNFKLEAKLEKHDIYHVLTGYPTTVLGEISLSSFNIGTGKRSLYTFLVAIVGAFIMLENMKIFIKAFKKGKSAKNYTKWQFEYLLKEKTQDLQKLLFNNINYEYGII